MVSKAKIQANSRYNVRKYDVLSVRVDKSESINSLLDKATAATGESKAKYVLTAIKQRMAIDGIIDNDKGPDA